MTVVSPYTFEVDLGRYRERGVVPPDTPNPYFHMFLLDHGRAPGVRAVADRYRGTHPAEETCPNGIAVRSTPAEKRRWINTQHAVLTALRKAAEELVRELDSATAVATEALHRCDAAFQAVGEEHEPVWLEIWGRIDEAQSRAPWPVERPDTPQRRAQREYNQRYGSGYSSG
ncbi:hypothetical protein SAMN05421810_101879 [Amycolatopsis arida]|uniref:Uncharacterized protein n=1 Tax=Amycolatopsis arida TaxID=587909 RepID=A0A1I5MD62_9PSEU|nr:hypothetical protein [Amycolatopsis arida]TDX94053.1 hypothetical protein CLV69_104511 [Amycolatopsis arida]SFP07463.1 hypothetical protein SAMN05421810_101879 [Amycolatopsis arida]